MSYLTEWNAIMMKNLLVIASFVSCAIQKWFINWLNEGIEYFIFSTCDASMGHPFTFYQSNNNTTTYYDEEAIDSPEDHFPQHYESDYEDSLPDLEEVVTDDDDDDYDPYKNYYYDDPKKTNDDINDITPQQALDVIEKMDTPITFGSMSYDEALELQQNAEDTWNNNTGWNTYLDSNVNRMTIGIMPVAGNLNAQSF